MFPSLEGGVQIQYRSTKLNPSRHRPFRFLDNSRQAIIVTDHSQFAWDLRYDSLTGIEANRFRAFFESLDSAGTFDFPDPWSGITYPKVRFSAAGITIDQTGPAAFRVEFRLEEEV